jgi:hypothetical protein
MENGKKNLKAGYGQRDTGKKLTSVNGLKYMVKYITVLINKEDVIHSPCLF